LNRAMIMPDGTYFVYSVLKVPRTEAGHEVRGLSVNLDGSVREVTVKAVFRSRKAAEDRLRTLARMKMLKKKAREVSEHELPDVVRSKLAPDLDSVMGPADFLGMVEREKNRRVVVFRDVTGLEDVFEPDVEYDGVEDPDDGDIVVVTGPDGEPRNCFRSRFLRIDITPGAREASAKGILNRTRASGAFDRFRRNS